MDNLNNLKKEENIKNIATAYFDRLKKITERKETLLKELFVELEKIKIKQLRQILEVRKKDNV